MSRNGYICVVATLLLLIGLYVYISRPPADTATNAPAAPNQPVVTVQMTAPVINQEWKRLLSMANGPAAGPPNAPYTVVEIGDFQCPQCGKLRPTLEAVMQQSAGKAKLYFVNYPLSMIHPHAEEAAEASLAGSAQGKFWQTYEMLYAHQDELIPSEIEYYAKREIPGLDSARFNSELQSHKYANRVKDQLAEGNNIRVQFTPTVIVRRTTGGTPVFYIGSKGEGSTPGIYTLAENPPWHPALHGMTPMTSDATVGQ